VVLNGHAPGDATYTCRNEDASAAPVTNGSFYCHGEHEGLLTPERQNGSAETEDPATGARNGDAKKKPLHYIAMDSILERSSKDSAPSQDAAATPATSGDGICQYSHVSELHDADEPPHASSDEERLDADSGGLSSGHVWKNENNNEDPAASGAQSQADTASVSSASSSDSDSSSVRFSQDRHAAVSPQRPAAVGYVSHDTLQVAQAT
jgi:hypothetical protein